MPKFSFENFHPNHKFAFLDGFLCGVAAVGIGAMFYKDYLQNKAEREAIMKANEEEARLKKTSK